jgi:hypothetical protein
LGVADVVGQCDLSAAYAYNEAVPVQEIRTPTYIRHMVHFRKGEKDSQNSGKTS